MRLFIRIAVSAAIMVLIFRTIEFGEVWSVLRAADPSWLALAVALQFTSSAVAAYRWQLLMHNLDFGQSSGFYLRSYLKGMFFNQGLPTSIGGDAMRVLDVARQGFRKRDSLYGVAVDRATGLGALLALNIVAVAIAPAGLLPDEVFYAVITLAFLGVAVFVLTWLARDLRALREHPRLELVFKVSERLRQAFASKRLVLVTTSLLVHVLAMLCLFAIGTALGLDYGPLTYAVIVPPAILLTVVPISLAGWGVREGALVALFTLIGADQASVLAMSILYGIVLIVVSVSGLYVYLGERRRYA